MHIQFFMIKSSGVLFDELPTLVPGYVQSCYNCNHVVTCIVIPIDLTTGPSIIK